MTEQTSPPEPLDYPRYPHALLDLLNSILKFDPISDEARRRIFRRALKHADQVEIILAIPRIRITLEELERYMQAKCVAEGGPHARPEPNQPGAPTNGQVS